MVFYIATSSRPTLLWVGTSGMKLDCLFSTLGSRGFTAMRMARCGPPGNLPGSVALHATHHCEHTATANSGGATIYGLSCTQRLSSGQAGYRGGSSRRRKTLRWRSKSAASVPLWQDSRRALRPFTSSLLLRTMLTSQRTTTFRPSSIGWTARCPEVALTERLLCWTGCTHTLRWPPWRPPHPLLGRRGGRRKSPHPRMGGQTRMATRAAMGQVVPRL
mmetsp:Transcript_34409/g.90212  ORF Transcript_34409/g.90212 Transcript_34409/m.90212 type:complete len:218 (-) Transcript_34409:685-1338(-)